MPAPPFDWVAAREHCRIAWLRGRFLARGSLSLGVGRTHLELLVGPDEAAPLAARLADAGHAVSWRIRRGSGVLTWKRADAILELLRRMGATGAALELESRLVTHQLHGHLNRVINAETANLRRSVGAAARQGRAVAALRDAGRLDDLPPLEHRVALARLERPEATLAELAAELELSRPRVQRALARIEAAAGPGGDVG